MQEENVAVQMDMPLQQKQITPPQVLSSEALEETTVEECDNSFDHVQRQNNALLDFLQKENAKALKSIQEENSTFIMQHQTENSMELVSMEKVAGAGTDNTMMTITQQNASYHIIQGNLSPEREEGNEIYENRILDLEQMNEALVDENDRLKKRLESMLDLLQQFDEER